MPTDPKSPLGKDPNDQGRLCTRVAFIGRLKTVEVNPRFKREVANRCVVESMDTSEMHPAPLKLSVEEPRVESSEAPPKLAPQLVSEGAVHVLENRMVGVEAVKDWMTTTPAAVVSPRSPVVIVTLKVEKGRTRLPVIQESFPDQALTITEVGLFLRQQVGDVEGHRKRSRLEEKPVELTVWHQHSLWLAK